MTGRIRLLCAALVATVTTGVLVATPALALVAGISASAID